MISLIKSLLKRFYICWLLRRRWTSIKFTWNVFKTNMLVLDQVEVSNNRVGEGVRRVWVCVNENVDVDRCWWKYYNRYLQTPTRPVPTPFFFSHCFWTYASKIRILHRNDLNKGKSENFCVTVRMQFLFCTRKKRFVTNLYHSR